MSQNDKLTPGQRYELGLRYGLLIKECFEVVAKMDGVTLQEAIDDWVANYVAERIIEEAGK